MPKISDERLNRLLDKLNGLHLNDIHFANLEIRRNGKYEHIEFDDIKILGPIIQEVKLARKALIASVVYWNTFSGDKLGEFIKLVDEYYEFINDTQGIKKEPQ